MRKRLERRGKACGLICNCAGPTLRLVSSAPAQRANSISQAPSERDTRPSTPLAFGKEVTLQTHGKDKYGRTLAEVLLPDGMNLNQELVKDGWCWWYRKYAPRDTGLEGLEKDAREAKKGLWADPHPVPPWEWRKR